MKQIAYMLMEHRHLLCISCFKNYYLSDIGLVFDYYNLYPNYVCNVFAALLVNTSPKSFRDFE